MERIRRGYELRTLFLGRPVRPFHLAITVSTLVVAVSNLTVNDTTLLGHNVSHLLGALALVSAVMLIIGWWATNDFSAEWGLLIATGVWVTRAVYICLTGNTYVFGTVASVSLSLAWAVGASGAYVLERYDHVLRDLDE